jgi:hypothetical protein
MCKRHVELFRIPVPSADHTTESDIEGKWFGEVHLFIRGFNLKELVQGFACDSVPGSENLQNNAFNGAHSLVVERNSN